MVKRVATTGEHFAIAGWREDAGFLLFHFPTWAKAPAMQHLIDRRHRAPAYADVRSGWHCIVRHRSIAGLGRHLAH